MVATKTLVQAHLGASGSRCCGRFLSVTAASGRRRRRACRCGGARAASAVCRSHVAVYCCLALRWPRRVRTCRGVVRDTRSRRDAVELTERRCF
eukprot:277094-Chlamydomonas_euryale.AAC.1